MIENKEKTYIGNKVLLLAHGHIGNNVFCTPTIRFLKKNFPLTVFDVVALNKSSSEVFEGNNDLDVIHILNTNRTVKKIAKNYSTLICLNPKSSDLLEGIEADIMYISPLPSGIHHADHMLQQIAQLTNCVLHDTDRAYTIKPSINRAEQILAKAIFNKGDILVGMHLGCARTAIHGWKFFYKDRASHQKLWPIEKYIELGKLLTAADPRIRIYITGSKHEKFLGRKFNKNVPHTINLIGKTSVCDLINVLNISNLFITQDCGILHVASASEVPLLALFGPTDPVSLGPYPKKLNRLVIKKGSMADIDPMEVANAAIQFFRLHE